MNFKIAAKNVRKSLKDYAIYFLTLSFAICIFYAFNAVGAQSKLQGITTDKKVLLEDISTMIGYISIFVSVVLGCLIIYANNFLIKRRKKELGLYMSLGMGKRRISKILVVEELIIGAFSLVFGMILGITISQILGILTNKLFQLGANEFQVIISFEAMVRTMVYFGIIFILVMIFNTIIISRYKLIDLLNANKKNEKIKVKNSKIAGAIFIIGVTTITIAYKLVMKVGFNPERKEFTIAIILGILGTLLFFNGIMGFTILIMEKVKKIYYKKLNIFTMRQVGSKINTNFISMAVICLMLFVTVSLISIAVGFKSQNVDGYLPVDATLTNVTYSGEYTVQQALKENGFKMPKGAKSEILNLKTIHEVNTQKVLGKYYEGENLEYYKNNEVMLNLVSLSDYNKFLKLTGKKEIELKDDEIEVISNAPFMKKTIENIINQGGEIELLNKKYKIKDKKVKSNSISNEGRPAYDFLIVARDSLVEKGKIDREIININYGINKSEEEAYIQGFFANGGFSMHSSNDEDRVIMMVNTKSEILRRQSELTSIVLYISIYIGAIFLVASAAVLALQQLSEASDSIGRYKMLKEIGASKSQVNKSIFKQLSVYFALPLILAIIHSIVGISVANELVSNLGKTNILEASLMTMIFIAVVYFGYFLVTYVGYKGIVRE